MGRAGIRASERPRATQAPVLFPSRELMVAKLQRKGGIGRIETGYARRSIGEIDLRASSPGVVDERHAERDRNLLGAHAESERRRIGLGSAKGGPADAKRRSDALECQCSSPAGMRRNAHGRPPTRAPIFGPLMEASQACAERAHLAATPAPRRNNDAGWWLSPRLWRAAWEIFTPPRGAAPRVADRSSARRRISFPSTRTRSRTGTPPSRTRRQLRRDHSTA